MNLHSRRTVRACATLVWLGCLLCVCAAPAAAIPDPTIGPAELRNAQHSGINDLGNRAADVTVYSVEPGEFYFRLDGTPTFLTSRNPTGKNQTEFEYMLDLADQGGSRLIRVHLTHGWWGLPWIHTNWTVNEAWAQAWEGFFDQAQAKGITVIPVFGVWADWNDGKPDYGNPCWQYNPLNRANGGPLDEPSELFAPGSQAQKAWMDWMQTLVARWQDRDNIAAWEIFSEINIAAGASGYADLSGGVDEPTGEDFALEGVAAIRAADPHPRPITLSLAAVYSPGDAWADFYRLEALDFIQLHMYHDALDRTLVEHIPQMRETYQKPVMIGESGLWSLNYAANAHLGIEHAMWAGLVSGAMNGRSLWYHDGYAIYDPYDPLVIWQFLQTYAATELPVARFIQGIDVSGFAPMPATSTLGVWGAAVGSETLVIGWYRDATCEPPDWNLSPGLSGQTVTLTTPVKAPTWKVEFFNTKTGGDILGSAWLTSNGDQVVIPLPDFTDDIAFKLYALGDQEILCPLIFTAPRP